MSDFLDFNSTISKADDYELLKTGRYHFEVLSHKIKKIDTGSMSGAKKVVMTLSCDGVHVLDDLVMHKKLSFKIWQFWDSCIKIENEDNFVPPWGKLDGQTGEVEVGVEDYDKRNGETGQRNTFKYIPYAKQNRQENHVVSDADVDFDF